MHLISRISNKYGGSQQNSCLMLARAVAHGRMTYGFPVYEFKSRQIQELSILNRTLIRTVTGLPRHTRTDILEQSVSLPPVINLVEETQLRFQNHLEHTPQGRAIQRWDLLKSEFDPRTVQKTLPPWERPFLGIIRRRPISRRHPEARERYVQKLSNDKEEGEVDLFTDAAVTDTAAAIAWKCPELPQLDGSRTITNTCGLTDEAELFGILGALQRIQNHSEQLQTRKFRVVTDSYVALRELNKAFTQNFTANSILKTVQELSFEGIKVRMAWTPAHTPGAQGNQLAHNSARECVQNPPLVPPVVTECAASAQTDVPTTNWQQEYRRFKLLSRQRLAEASPPGFLTPLKTLSRREEVFANKVYADAAYTPDVISKWTRNQASASKCTFCAAHTIPNLFHLIWSCSAFSSGREQLLESQAAPQSLSEHLQLIRGDPRTLERVANFAVQSGLYRVV